uniref:Uncharacterized protein n=1 Tax=Rhizophora mucronata TaxID=61149 RepID=A0A2P2J8M4_RHIMU
MAVSLNALRQLMTSGNSCPTDN